MTENKAPFSINRTLTTNNVKEIINIQKDHFAATSILIQVRISNGESSSKLSSFHKNSGKKKKQKLSEPTNSHRVMLNRAKGSKKTAGKLSGILQHPPRGLQHPPRGLQRPTRVSSALPVVSSTGPGSRLQVRKATTYTEISRPGVRHMLRQELRSL